MIFFTNLGFWGFLINFFKIRFKPMKYVNHKMKLDFIEFEIN